MCSTAVPVVEDERERFSRLTPELLRGDLHLALVLAEIGPDYLDAVLVSADGLWHSIDDFLTS